MKTKFFSVLVASLFTAQITLAQASGTNAINQASNNANSGNKSGQSNALMQMGMYAAMAAAEASQCGPKSPQMCILAAIHAAMAMQAGKQAKEHGNVAAQAYDTGTNTEGSWSPSDTTGGTGDNIDRTVADDANFRAVDDNMKKLVNGIEGAKINLKDGTVSYKGKDLTKVNPGDVAAMKAAGFSDADIAAAQALTDKVNEATAKKLGALTAASGFEEGGGGGGGGTGSSASTEEFGSPTAAKAATSARAPTNLSGMQKIFNGEPIGVAGDSIFLMMTRRYQVKEKQDAFYSEQDIALKQK